MKPRLLGLVILVIACGAASAPAGAASDADDPSTSSAMRKGKWARNVAIKFGKEQMRWRSNGLPNHALLPEYAIPNFGVIVPNPTNSHVESSSQSITAQNYDFRITTSPRRARRKTSVLTGPMGAMISGALVYNPYEGDGKTVALASNFTIKNASGADVPFADACNGHPSPFRAYHYHGRPDCVTAQVDRRNGPSHMIGVAFDGFPIYGDRDIHGRRVRASQLDSCNGITSPTPEFPKGIYHYVLLNVATKQSSMACFRGEVTPDLRRLRSSRRSFCTIRAAARASAD